MADSQEQYLGMVTIAEGLDAMFADRMDVLVACDLLWYWDPDDPRKCAAPDVFVALGRPKALRRSYKEWLEGRPPQVVFEIHSYHNRASEKRRKLALYDARGVEEYYYYPKTGRFDGWLRGPGGLAPIPNADGWTSPNLGVTFEAPPKEHALVVRTPSGEAFQHVQDIIKDRKAARRVAKIERRRRKEEQRRREESDRRALEERLRREQAERLAREERERADRLAARLRELGVDPD
ncbi:MAG: hypothetical protein BGO49_08290 [Planctomycetales bacterium 71-10]|nr:MAG: hypothetical protein BGO49_08290 [Planctomycetales bacterium 71-10]